jgi:hypothetical protein
MIRRTVSIYEVVELLNGLCQSDPVAMGKLIENRVPCSDTLIEHPSIQVISNENGQTTLGVLGILNGFFGADVNGWGAIAAVREEDGRVTEFKVIR